MNPVVSMEVWGDLACWTRPESKVERLTYPVPTPSGMRGVLSAVYSKPKEFYWQVRRIEVLKPIQYTSFRRNEVKSKMGRGESLCIEDDRTQRQSIMLKDVRYRVTAELLPQPVYRKPPAALLNQFNRRLERGQCFMQPSLGLRELVGYFGPATDAPPIDEDLDLGLMVYDVFDLHDCDAPEDLKRRKLKTAPPFVTLYRPQMRRGVIEVPPFDSPEVLRPLRGDVPC